MTTATGRHWARNIILAGLLIRLILAAGIAFVKGMKRARGSLGWLERSVMGLILAQMLLGVVLSQIGIVRVAQVLHIGLSSLLVSALFLVLLATKRKA